MKFTATHMTILGIVLLIGFFGYAIYDQHLQNQPEITPTEVIEQAVLEIFEGDSVVSIPIEVSYEYKDINFESNGDTTYWFFLCETRNQENDKAGNSRVIKLPYSHFDFLAAADYVAKEDTKVVFITYFRQISEASYYSYKPYSKKY